MSTVAWRQLKAHDFLEYAHAYHVAARKLARAIGQEPGPQPDLDLCPVLTAYRKALEVLLKGIVMGDGGGFLPVRPDDYSVLKTRSLSWLAQFVCQMLKELGWEDEFRSEFIPDIPAFRALVEEANDIDPGFAFRCPTAVAGTGSARDAVESFLRQLDDLFDLLARTADALAAEHALRSDYRGPLQ